MNVFSEKITRQETDSILFMVDDVVLILYKSTNRKKPLSTRKVLIFKFL